MRSILISIMMLAAVAAGPAIADEKHHAAATAPQAGGQLTDGEVRKVDREAKKLTIRHAPIQNLDMPAMTMVFQVRDAALLDKVKPGDKVQFVAEKAGGAYIVTHVEPAKQP